MELQEFRVAYEITSTIICLVLVRFMIKPYRLTGESRYLGLPLGFGALGLTYAISAFFYWQPRLLGTATLYIQLVLRTFAFVFLSVTYYLSRKKVENTRIVWNVTLSLAIIALITVFILASIPDVVFPSYANLNAYIRFFNLACIAYICIHTLRSHVEKPDPKTILIPFGYLFLGISQFSIIIYALDGSMSAWWAALAIRWAGFAIFLIVAYRSFWNPKKIV
jgi:hypothetical protein